MLNSEKMVASIQSQDLEHANKYFKRALKEDDAETLLELAEYLESIGFLPQAKEIYLQEREDYPEVNINLAQIATEDGDIEGAFLYLDSISPESDAYLSALLVMADIYEMEGLADVAREKLLQANQISDEPLVIFGLAEIEMELGNYNQAIKEYAKLDNRDILELLVCQLINVSVVLMPVSENLKQLSSFLKKLLRLNTMTIQSLNQRQFCMIKMNTKKQIFTSNNWRQ